jgi:hypothetical protein
MIAISFLLRWLRVLGGMQAIAIMIRSIDRSAFTSAIAAVRGGQEN